ncbi:MAG: protein kinase, partial [Akkermansia sp.]|nr:protein kinase [Akkermansia sp.]
MTQDSPEFNELALPLKAELRTYTLRKVLGWGSFGITYLAHDHSLDVDVVIKENLPKEYATRKPGSYEVVPFSQRKDDFKWAKDRFIQEARTLAKLNHPNIMRVMSIFEELGTAYYVMPYVGGRSLDKVLNQEGPLP